MMRESSEQDDDKDHVDELRVRPTNAYSTTIDTDLPSITFEEQSDFVSPVKHLEGHPALRNQSFQEDEAPSTDGRIGCFSLCDRTPER